MPSSRLISFTDLPRARPTSASRSAVMICSGVCRFLPIIDHRSLADRRDAAARDGDLDRAAELSREPNVHLGPSRHRAGGGAAAREKRRKVRRVEQANAAHAAERDTARRQVARVEREIAAVGARLKETYDRVRRALWSEPLKVDTDGAMD